MRQRSLMLRVLLVVVLAGWRLSQPGVTEAATAGPCNVQYCGDDCTSFDLCAEGCTPACVITNCEGNEYWLTTNCNYIE